MQRTTSDVNPRPSESTGQPVVMNEENRTANTNIVGDVLTNIAYVSNGGTTSFGGSTNVFNATATGSQTLTAGNSYSQSFINNIASMNTLKTMSERIMQANESNGAKPLVLNISPNDEAKQREEALVKLLTNLNMMFGNGLTIRTNDKDEAVLTATQDKVGTHEVTKHDLAKIG